MDLDAKRVIELVVLAVLLVLLGAGIFLAFGQPVDDEGFCCEPHPSAQNLEAVDVGGYETVSDSDDNL